MLTPITSLDDPRLEPYRNLKDRELARRGDLFIAEGQLLVQRMLMWTTCAQSVLCATRKLDAIAPLVPEHVPLYAAPQELVNRIVGYKFHTGAMAVGRRPPSPSIESLAAAWPQRVTLVVLPNIANTDNLGSMMRIAAGLGATAMLLGEHCCDPYYRQAVRVSMGAVFRLPVVRTDDLKRDMAQLRQRWGVQHLAAVLADDAEPLPSVARPDRIAVHFGNEAQGLPPEIVRLCDRRITIPMHQGTDSLNVAVSAGIILYHLLRA